MIDREGKTILVTGAAGFIGFYLTKRLLDLGYKIVGIDNMNEYYDITLKRSRLDLLKNNKNFNFINGDLVNKDLLFKTFERFKPVIVFNLAAQAGVRYSIDNPDTYMQSNIIGFFNILEACRYYPVRHLLYASSSSVYGANKKVPFEESDFVDNPVSLYAATKKSNELMAYTYSHLYKIPSIGLRFFTVYGPMGRPDMAYYNFANKYFKGEPIHVYNNGNYDTDLYRDFTYIDDIIEGMVLLMDAHQENCELYKIYNIGNNQPVKLMHFIETLENSFSIALKRNIKFDKVFEPIKDGDVPVTFASTKKLFEDIGFQPKTTIEEGLMRFASWYVTYYHLK